LVAHHPAPVYTIVMRIVLGISGGIAAYKTPALIRELVKRGHEVGAALTPAATQFVAPLAVRTVATHDVLVDLFAETSDGIGHIELADWAEVIAVAPATATTLSRLAAGAAEEPVSLTCLASRAAKIVFPAMNVNMWQAAATQRNMTTLEADGYKVVPPDSGTLACGWEGAGRLPELSRLATWIEYAGTPNDLAGKHVVVTAGPSREPLDPVRFLSNPSSGRMGFAVAEAAAAYGADVTLIAGPTELPPPPGVTHIGVDTAAAFAEAVEQTLAVRTADLFVGAAAIADWAPAQRAAQKLKKTENPLDVDFAPTPDILARAVAGGRVRYAIGFAAETEDVERHARAKLERKGLDAIVANNVGDASGGFSAATNRITLIDRRGDTTTAEGDKRALGRWLVDQWHEAQSSPKKSDTA